MNTPTKKNSKKQASTNKNSRHEADYYHNWAKYTEKHRKKFLMLLEKNKGNISRTCRQMGIKGAHDTVNNWRKRHPWFDKAMAEYQDYVFDVIETNVFAIAVDESKKNLHNPQALTARKFLLTYHPAGHARGYKPRGELTGEGGGPLTIRSFVEIMEKVEKAYDEDGKTED